MRALVELGAGILDFGVFAAVGYVVGRWWAVTVPTALMLVAWLVFTPASFSESSFDAEGAVSAYGIVGMIASLLGWMIRQRIGGRARVHQGDE